jgi:hypothetical protein
VATLLLLPGGGGHSSSSSSSSSTHISLYSINYINFNALDDGTSP